MNPSSLYQDPLLSQLAQRFRNREFIADQIFPEAPVAFETFKYLEWDRGVTFRRVPTQLNRRGSANELDLSATKKTGNTEGHGLKTGIDEMEERQAPGMAIKSLKTEALMTAHLLDQECAVAGLITDPSVITNTLALAGANRWDDPASHPKKKVLELKRGLISDPNVMVVGREVHDALLLHPEILDAVKYTQGAVDVSNVLARYFGFEKYLVGSASVNSAKEGQAESLGFVWGKNVFLGRVAQRVTAAMDEASVGYIARYQGGGAGAWRTFSWVDPNEGTGAGMQWVKVEGNYKVLLTAPILGYLLTTVVS